VEHRHYVHSAPAGFVYLAAILDWYSRKVLAWRLSNTLETRFCLDCLDEALRRGQPSIFNSDQGAQFTSTGFTGRLAQAGIRISMDGRGRPMTISLWNGCGDRSSMKKCIPTAMTRWMTPITGCTGTSSSTTTSGPIRPWATKPQPRCMPTGQ